VLQRRRHPGERSHLCLAGADAFCCAAAFWAGLLSEPHTPRQECPHHAPVQALPEPTQTVTTRCTTELALAAVETLKADIQLLVAHVHE
jgi:hypothetical protein